MSWQTPASTAETSSIVVSGAAAHPNGLVIRPSVPIRPGCQHAQVLSLKQKNRVRISDNSAPEARRRSSKAPKAGASPATTSSSTNRTVSK